MASSPSRGSTGHPPPRSPPRSPVGPAPTRHHSPSRTHTQNARLVTPTANSSRAPSPSPALLARTVETPSTIALATADALLTASSSPRANTSGGNPAVQAIQSRVAELVRRFDESFASDRAGLDDDEDDDRGSKGEGAGLDLPRRWRVGDVLLATHAALAKTSTRTERVITTEFGDDPEVTDVLGDGEARFSSVMAQVATKAEEMRGVMAKTLQLVKQLQLADETMRLDETRQAGSAAAQLREMKIMVDALHKEKSMILGQLHEQVRSHREMIAMMEEQNQELKKAQIALGMKNDELRGAREDFSFRLQELQRSVETSQQNGATWRDKFQGTTRALAEAEQKAGDLEKRVAALQEDVRKHDIVLQTKNQELEKQRERLRESEALRHKAESAAQRDAAAAAAVASKADAEARARTRAEKESAAKGAGAKLSAKEREELEAKIRQHETTIAALEKQLRDVRDSRSKFEEDNNELARIVREMQIRAQELMNAPRARTPSRPTLPGTPPAAAPVRRSSSFSLSFRRAPTQRRIDGTGVANAARRPRRVDDDLSTSSDEEGEDSETEQNDMELNEAVQQVVTSVFPERAPPLPQTDDAAIDDSIAKYEDPTTSPISAVNVVSDASRAITPATRMRMTRVGGSAGAGSTMDSVEMEKIRLEHDEEVARLKKQYVSGLLEYKRLVIEQYDRRQAEIQQRHRLEIENLIVLVQEKFRRELERRGEKMLQAKESLKMLYRAMKMDAIREAPLAEAPREAASTSDEENVRPPSAAAAAQSAEAIEEEAVPLKSLLRAAVFAMSSSKQRNEKGAAQIAAIYEDVSKRRQSRSARRPVAKVTLAGSTAPASPRHAHPPPASGALTPASPRDDTDWEVFLRNMRAQRESPQRKGEVVKRPAVIHVACQVEPNDFQIFDLRGLRGTHTAPENMEGFVLPSARCLNDHAGGDSPDDASTPRNRLAMRPDGIVFFTEGAVFSDEIVHELRAVLPFLPPGAYFLSSLLRQELMVTLVRFYADLDGRRAASRKAEHSADRQERDSSGDHAAEELVIGSPRDTPFMRRKALDGVARRRVQRRRDFENRHDDGARLTPHRLPSVSSLCHRRLGGCICVSRFVLALVDLKFRMYSSNVSNLDQILSSLQIYVQSSRVRQDVYNLLRQIPSLQPNCGTFAHNDGTTSTLLNLEGTIPIFYRGNQYNIPVEFWMVETYPHAPPVCFVRPTADMMVKPGHPHVTSDGFVKIPYITEWRQDFTLVELVAHMCSIFGNIPPVFRRPAQATPQFSSSPYSQSPATSNMNGYYQQSANSSYAQSQPTQAAAAYSGYGSYQQGGRSSESSLFGSTPTRKIQQEMERLFKRVRDDIDVQFEHQLSLTQSKENVERGIQSLEFLRDDLVRANGVIVNQDREVQQWLDENESKDTVDPDSILIEADGLSKQLIKTMAENHAIEDALYFMDRALSNGEMELASFLKEVRKLARQQFMCQALIQKITERQAQLSAPSYNNSPPVQH
ncbi:hypothetical protein ATCC90586_008954 [Pythium insidiosum]|nr:hypothetical protein ATCC90586_008954 [Pythium insidiosum]